MCSVCTITCSQACSSQLAPVAADAWLAPIAACSSRPSQLAPAAHGAQRVARNSRGALVDTSVYLKPTELVDVALDVLARLAPCLNLGVGELGHKDLLDTISANNCRK